MCNLSPLSLVSLLFIFVYGVRAGQSDIYLLCNKLCVTLTLTLTLTSFTPLVFSTSGGFAPEVGRVLEKAAGEICKRHRESYSETMTFIREKTRFSLLRSTLVALRGTKRRVVPIRMEDVDFRDK